MSNKSETNSLHEDSDTIDDKRRKNVIDNQKFLESLKLLNARDDLKSTVNSITTTRKPERKKSNQKKKINPSETRRSSRIKSMPQINYNNEFQRDDENFVLSTSVTSSSEYDDLSSAFLTKIDKEWIPLHPEKVSNMKIKRPVRKTNRTITGSTKIFMPNIGLEASKIRSKNNSYKSYVSKKLNVAISSSSEEED